MACPITLGGHNKRVRKTKRDVTVRQWR